MPLQKVAMGLVIVVIEADMGGFDALPDVLGWVLVIAGVLDLRTVLAGFGTLLTLAALSAAVSAALLWPGLADSFTESTGWLLSLPQLAFSIALCGSVAAVVPTIESAVARSFSRMRWVFGALALAPAVLYGGEVDALLAPLAFVTVAANVFLIVTLFRISKRPYALGPSRVSAD